MKSNNPIDLSKLPLPDLVESKTVEQIIEERKAELISRGADRDMDLSPVLALKSDPLVIDIEQSAHREYLLRNRINVTARSTMLAYAKGADLDHVAARNKVERLVIDAGDPQAIPPIPPTYESDERLALRVQLALDGLNTAGSTDSYIYHAMTANSLIKSASAISPSPAHMTVVIQHTDGNGTPDQVMIDEVGEYLSGDKVVPAGDRVAVVAPEIVDYQADATLTLYHGLDGTVILDAALKAVNDYISKHKLIGHDITISGLHHALHQEGVMKVTLANPVSDITISEEQLAHCTSLNVVIGGYDE